MILQELTFLCATVLQKYEETILLSISSLVATADNVADCYRYYALWCHNYITLALNTQFSA